MSHNREMKTRGEERAQLHTALAPGGEDSATCGNISKVHGKAAIVTLR